MAFQFTKPALHLLSHLLLLLQFVTCTIQVDITLHLTYSIAGRIDLVCSSIPPGICCKGLQRTPGYPDRHARAQQYKDATFQELLIGDIAAVWETRRVDEGPLVGSYGSCSSRILQTGHGPGEWVYNAPENGPMTALADFKAIGGASYIKVPTIAPPDQGMIQMLTMEGVLGLVWGGGKWFASAAAANMVAREGSGGLVGGTPKTKRGITSRLTGTVCAQGPSKWAYPDVVVVNGTRYSGGRGDLIYKSEDGTFLNFTSIMEQDV